MTTQTALPSAIRYVRISSVEGAEEMAEMVTRTFKTPAGWAAALAAIKRDAADYLPGLSYNTVRVEVTCKSGPVWVRLDVTAHTADPFPMEVWADCAGDWRESDLYCARCGRARSDH